MTDSKWQCPRCPNSVTVHVTVIGVPTCNHNGKALKEASKMERVALSSTERSRKARRVCPANAVA